MKKRFLSVLLCLCMVLGLVPVTVWAATGNGHTHYLCGGSTCNGSGHETESGMTTFAVEIKQNGSTLKIGGEPWAPTKGSNDTFYILPAGTYYLGSDISPEYTIKIESNVTLCLNGHKITAANEKDAIKLTGGSFNLTDCQKTGNITHASSKTGRGVYVNSGRFNMYGGSITGNKATDGGGVYMIGSNSTFTMTGGSITGNTADDSGGGVYINAKTNFNMYGGAICGNTATRNFGGGVCVYNNSNSNFNMSDGEIGDNGARCGGGVFVGDNSTLTMTGGSITGNNVSGRRAGGGIYISDSAKNFTVSGNIQITGNMKTGTRNENGKYTGGKVENLYLLTGETITVGGALTNGAKLGVTLSSYYGDNAFTSGWNANMSDKSPADYFISDVDGKGFELSGEEVKLSDGHTHYLCGGKTCTEAGHDKETQMTQFTKPIYWDGTNLHVNDKVVSKSDDSYTLPADNYYLSSDLTLDGFIHISGNVTLCLNGHSITANHDGDVIVVNSGVTFTLTDCKGGNSDAAFGKITHASGKNGRGVYVDSATFNMYGGSITGNKVNIRGGGVYIIGSNSTFTMKGGSITGNTATYGGGVCVTGGTFEMTGGSITGNTASYDGGGVYVTNSGSFKMSGGTITGNKATDGGGVEVYGGKFTMEDSASITGNKADYGGGVYAEKNSIFYMYGGSITGNNAKYDGGGVYKAGAFYILGNIQIKDNVQRGTKGSDGKYTGGTANNVYIPVYHVISIGDTLTEGSKIGVTLDSNFGESGFTSGWINNMSGKNPADYFISDADGYAAKLNGSELKMVSTHVHNWTYTASGDTVTATCKNCPKNGGNDYLGGKAVIIASDSVYDGKEKTAEISKTGSFENITVSNIVYKKNGTALTGNGRPVDAGTYTASFTVGGVIASVTYTIDKAAQEAPNKLSAKPADKNSKGRLSGTTSKMEYNTDADAATGWKACSDGSTEVEPGTYYVRLKATDNNYAGEVSEALTVNAYAHTHTVGTPATCTGKAICAECGEGYGETNPNYHTALKHTEARAATRDAEGNIEYWHCLGCNKYFSDENMRNEIELSDTVTARLSDAPKTGDSSNSGESSAEKVGTSPKTGDGFNTALWLVILIIGIGTFGATAIIGRRKHSR